MPAAQQPIRYRDRIRHFVKDGVWSSVCAGSAETHFSAYIATVSSSAAHLSGMSAMQNLLGSGLQLFSERWIVLFGGRKRFVLACVSVQIVALLGMLAVIAASLGVWPFMAMTLIFTAVGSLSGPAWNSWIGDLLPSRRRGACFGIRYQRTHPANFAAMMIGGGLLHHFGSARSIELAFLSVFAIGLIAKILSLWHLQHQPDRPSEPPSRTLGPFALLQASWKSRRIRRSACLFSAMAFAINIGGPLQTAYMLQTLRLSFLEFAIANAAMVLTRFICAPFSGRIVDRMGSRGILALSSLLMPVIPFGWCVARGFYGVLLVQLVSGLICAAYDLCSFTYLAETNSAQTRHRAFTARQVGCSLAGSAGAMLGGTLLVAFGSVTSVFWCSMGARAVAGAYAFGMLAGWTGRRALIGESTGLPADESESLELDDLREAA